MNFAARSRLRSEETNVATILVVDDDPNSRLLLASLLKYAGHVVIEAENGAVGLDLANQHVPDLAIFDLSMPAVDGVTFARRIREVAALSRVKLALSTGTTLTEAMEDFLRLYRVGTVIPKPAEPEQILELIRNALA